MSPVVMVALIRLAVLAPVLGAGFLTLALLVELPVGERFIRRLCEATSLSLLISSLVLLVSSLVSSASDPHVVVALFPTLHTAGVELEWLMHADLTACVFGALGGFLMLFAIRFSSRYLHRDPSFGRFFGWLLAFESGVALVAFSSGLELLFVGWEIIGLSSALLIAFFRDVERAPASSLGAWAAYRFADACFLLAIGVTSFRPDSAWALGGGLVAMALLMGAAAKSAQFPFCQWLPRAMKGPTPSSAVFYGGLAVHVGPILLLKTRPFWEPFPAVRVAMIALGFFTCAYASLVGRVRGDAKSSLGYATVAQVGLIFVEIGFGLDGLALWHLSGHALLRTWEFLNSPGLIPRVEDGEFSESLVERRTIASPAWAVHALNGFYLESLWRKLVLLPLARAVGGWLATFRNRVARLVAGFVVVSGAAAVVARAPVSGIEKAVVAFILLAESLQSRSERAGVRGFWILLQPGWLAFVICSHFGLLPDTGNKFLAVTLLIVAFWRAVKSAAGSDHREVIEDFILSIRATIPAAWILSHDGKVGAGFEEIAWFSGAGLLLVMLAFVEKRFARLTLDRHHAIGARAPRLAAAYLMSGFALSGLPVSISFLAEDLELHAFLSRGLLPAVLYVATLAFGAFAFYRAYLHTFYGRPLPAHSPRQNQDLSGMLYFSALGILIFLAAAVLEAASIGTWIFQGGTP